MLAGWACALAAFGACGVGVYVGRYLRLNTWDLVEIPDFDHVANGCAKNWPSDRRNDRT